MAKHHRALLPDLKPNESFGGDTLDPPFKRPQLPTPTNTTRPAPRRPKTRSKTDEEWEAQKETIRNLYEVENRPLEGVIKVMDEENGFQAS